MSHSLPRKIDMVNPENGVSLYLELPTIFLAALFGAAYFSTRGMSSLGSLGAGMAIGLGGGILRDVVLNIEPAAFSNWYFVPVALAGALIGGVLRTRVPGSKSAGLLRSVIVALLLIVGLEKAYQFGNPIISVVLIGILTAVGGTVLVGLLTGVDLLANAGGAYLVFSLLLASTVFLLVASTGHTVAAEVAGGLVFVIVRMTGANRGWTVHQLPGELPAQS